MEEEKGLNDRGPFLFSIHGETVLKDGYKSKHLLKAVVHGRRRHSYHIGLSLVRDDTLVMQGVKQALIATYHPN